MYLGQQVGYGLQELADVFSVNHVGTISYALTHVRQLLKKDIKLARQLDRLKQDAW